MPLCTLFSLGKNSSIISRCQRPPITLQPLPLSRHEIILREKQCIIVNDLDVDVNCTRISYEFARLRQCVYLSAGLLGVLSDEGMWLMFVISIYTEREEAVA
jgi:hypothetical protein